MLEVWLRCAHPDSVAPPEIPFRGILDPVARKLRLPFGTPDFIDRIIRGGVNQAGRRTLQMLITTWDATGGGPFAASAMATAVLANPREMHGSPALAVERLAMSEEYRRRFREAFPASA